MNILMTADTVGGVWTYAVELCRQLSRAGANILLATKGAKLSSAQRSQLQGISGIEIKESDYRLEWMENPWDEVDRAAEWLLELAFSHRPDLIHLNDYAHGALELGAPKIVVGHSCVLSWWQAVKRSALPNEWATYQRRVTEGIRAVDAVVAPSRAMMSALLLHYGPLGHSRVIYNGRDSEPFRPGKKAPIVLTAGRLWDEAKNLALLRQVAPHLPWPVYVAGEGGEGESRDAGLRRLGKLSQPELAEWLRVASIYVMPARYEPFGLSVLEAAQAGCALVLGDIDSLRELWHGAAVFVPPDNADALQSAVVELISRPQMRSELVRKSRMRALALTPERMASQYLQLYREVLQRQVVPQPKSERATCAW